MNHRRFVAALACLLLALAALASGSPPAPVQMEHGVLYVQAQIDGIGPLLFTFDPGGADLYTSYARSRLHGHSPKTICIAGACFSAAMQYFDGDPNELDPNHNARDGVIAGNIGSALVRHYVVRIDYRASRLTVIPTAEFRPSEGSRGVPLTFDSYGMPVVRATVDGITAPFELDVRAPTSMLFRPFLQRTRLGQSYVATPVVKRSKSGLIAHAVRVANIGGFELHDMAFWFSTATSGKFANREVAGLLGNNVLSHFVLTLNIPHESLYLSL